MHKKDVLQLADLSQAELRRILSRRGSRYIELKVLNSQDYKALQRSRARGSNDCPKDSECIDGGEFCCGDKTARNACYGRWRCE